MKAVLTSYTLSLAVFIPVSGWVADRFGTRARLLLGHRPLHARLAPVRHLHRHPRARRLPHPPGLRRRDDGAGRPAHHGARLRQVGARPRHELRRDPGADRPDDRARWPAASSSRYLHWRMIFFVNLPIGLVGLFLVYRHLPDYRAAHTRPARLGGAGPLRLRRRPALVRARDLRRAHAGRARRSAALLARRLLLLAAYWRHAARAAAPAPAPGALPHPHAPRRRRRQLRHAPRRRRDALSPAAPLPGRASATRPSSRASSSCRSRSRPSASR